MANLIRVTLAVDEETRFNLDELSMRLAKNGIKMAKGKIIKNALDVYIKTLNSEDKQ